MQRRAVRELDVPMPDLVLSAAAHLDLRAEGLVERDRRLEVLGDDVDEIEDRLGIGHASSLLASSRTLPLGSESASRRMRARVSGERQISAVGLHAAQPSACTAFRLTRGTGSSSSGTIRSIPRWSGTWSSSCTHHHRTTGFGSSSPRASASIVVSSTLRDRSSVAVRPPTSALIAALRSRFEASCCTSSLRDRSSVSTRSILTQA